MSQAPTKLNKPLKKYTRRIPVFEAAQWFEFGDHMAVERWSAAIEIISDDPFTLGKTLEWHYGLMYKGKLYYVDPGMYIVPDINGEFYAMKAENFERVFKEIDNG